MIYHVPQFSVKQAIRQAKGRDLSRLSNLRETNNHAGARAIEPAQQTERDKLRSYAVQINSNRSLESMTGFVRLMSRCADVSSKA